MPSITRLSVLAAAVLLSAAAAHAGSAEVSFIEPDRFADAGRGSLETERTTKALAEIFQAQAKKLPDGQTLKVEVTEVDLAGELRWSPRVTQEIRVLRGRADWPRLELRYALSEGGRVIKSGDARLADMTYLQHTLPPRHREAYGYEARMIERWFGDTFGATVASR